MYSYLGKEKHLQLALDLGASICKDLEGNSAMYYALSRNSQSCIDCILQFMVDLGDKDRYLFSVYSYSIRDDFTKLVKNKSNYLLDYLNTLFYVSNESHLPLFAIPKGKLPLHYFSNTEHINPDTFVYKKAEVSGNEEHLEFKTIPFAIPFNVGSSESIRLIESIQNCSRPEILQSELISLIIKLKWSKFRSFILFQTILIWLNLISMTYIVIYDLRYHIMFLLFLCINFLLLTYEIVQIIVLGVKEYASFWNSIDFLRFLAVITFTVCCFYGYAGDLKFYTVWGMIFLNYFRGLTGFRAFSQTRFYLRLISRSFFDTIPFIIIFFYSTIAFGVLDYGLIPSKNPDSVFTIIWKSSYDLNLGNFTNNSDNFDLKYVHFMLASVVNVIIMLNLLISILGDSFEKFQVEAGQLDAMEMLDVIAEIEKIMFWARESSQNVYIQRCYQRGYASSSQNWQGRVFKIEKKIDEFSNKVVNTMLKDNLSLDKRFKSLENSIKPLQNTSGNNEIQISAIQSSIEDLGTKIETIQANIIQTEKNLDEKLNKLLEILSKQ